MKTLLFACVMTAVVLTMSLRPTPARTGLPPPKCDVNVTMPHPEAMPTPGKTVPVTEGKPPETCACATSLKVCCGGDVCKCKDCGPCSHDCGCEVKVKKDWPVPPAPKPKPDVDVVDDKGQVVGYEWKQATDPSQFGLMKDGKQIGAWSSVTGAYREYDAATRTWGAFAPPPVPPPARLFYALPPLPYGGPTQFFPQGAWCPGGS